MARAAGIAKNHRVLEIGREHRRALVIEDFLADPAALLAMAARSVFRPRVRFYPGVQAPFPFERMAALIAPHKPALREIFGVGPSLALVESGFAMVTTPPGDLAPLQRIPHVDTTDPDRLAILCYVSGAGFGGTAFYRHKSTGYEFIDASRHAAYNAALDRDVERLGVPEPGYIDGDTDLFEMIASVDAKPGRAVIYPSNSLHSGSIRNADRLSHRVAAGRLTLNAFVVPA